MSQLRFTLQPQKQYKTSIIIVQSIQTGKVVFDMLNFENRSGRTPRPPNKPSLGKFLDPPLSVPFDRRAQGFPQAVFVVFFLIAQQKKFKDKQI